MRPLRVRPETREIPKIWLRSQVKCRGTKAGKACSKISRRSLNTLSHIFCNCSTTRKFSLQGQALIIKIQPLRQVRIVCQSRESFSRIQEIDSARSCNSCTKIPWAGIISKCSFQAAQGHLVWGWANLLKFSVKQEVRFSTKWEIRERAIKAGRLTSWREGTIILMLMEEQLEETY